MDADRERRIREIAYDLWEQAGKPAEGEDQFWFQAERQLQEQNGGGTGLNEDASPFAGEGQPISSDAPNGVPEPSDQPASSRRRGGRAAR